MDNMYLQVYRVVEQEPRVGKCKYFLTERRKTEHQAICLRLRTIYWQGQWDGDLFLSSPSRQKAFFIIPPTKLLRFLSVYEKFFI